MSRLKPFSAVACTLVFATCFAQNTPAGVPAISSADQNSQQDQFPAHPNVRTLVGRVLSQNDVRYIFRDYSTDGWYHLDDQAKAKAFFGKDVVVTGTIDGLTGTIRIQSIREKTADDQIPAPPEPPTPQPSVEQPPTAAVPKMNTIAPTEPMAKPIRATESTKVEPPAIPAPAPVPTRVPAPVSEAVAPRPAAIPKPAPKSTVDSSQIIVNLPEEAVAASSSVAIISRRSIALPAGTTAHHAGDTKNLVVGKPLKRTVPSYPYEAEQQRVEGTVKLHAVVGADGAVRSVDPVSGPEPLIDAATLAVREWRFGPTRLDGRPVDVHDDVTLFFRLPN